MGRLNDWPERLNNHIDEWRDKNFDWGKADCALFCLYGEKAMCGTSRFEDFLGTYSTDFGSLRALKKLGTGELTSTVAARLPEINISEAQRGDVVSIDTPEGQALALFVGDKIAALGENGLLFLPVSLANRAWRI